MNNMARRDVFVSLAAMVAAVTLPSLGSSAGEGRGKQTGRLLDILVPDTASAGRLGRAYLTAHPAEVDRQRLVDWVLERLRLPGGADAVDSTPAAESIARARQAVTGDYIAGRVVDIDGWVLSITEARLYALAALTDADTR